MKKRNRMIALLMGTVLTVSMAGTAMAGTATAAKTSPAVTSTQKTTGNTLADEKEMKEFFGKIKKVNKDSVEIETATADKEKVAGTATKTSAKTDAKTDTKADEKTSEDKPQELALDGETMTAAITAKTAIFRETEQDADKKTKNSEKSTTENKKTNISKTESIKLSDLKAGDIVKITMKDGKNVTEVTVLKNVKVVEKDSAKKETGKQTTDKKTVSAK